MAEASPPPPQPKPMTRTRKGVIVLVASVIAAMIVVSLKYPLTPDASVYVGAIIGNVLFFFGIGTLVAWCVKGSAGATSGVITVVVLTYIILSQSCKDRKAERDAPTATDKHEQTQSP
jgi:hypothetical protein